MKRSAHFYDEFTPAELRKHAEKLREDARELLAELPGFARELWDEADHCVALADDIKAIVSKGGKT